MKESTKGLDLLFQMACGAGSAEKVANLLSGGNIDLNANNEFGMNALVIAAEEISI